MLTEFASEAYPIKSDPGGTDNEGDPISQRIYKLIIEIS